ncbi:TPA: MurR/RpiR family transcriptional regulator [Streptococcus suis]|uniref:MurR/RpiR family transcriptional regulator n=1 Tax=Streptococcus parasuis TaxID=1501662 RepID=UPI002A7D67ED|nr:MurR/RpiR family transcriptional regulator [Streptococcus suis]
MIATGKNIIAIIESNMDEMTELEQEIARYFTQLDPVDADLTLEFTTATLHVSPSALTRFAKKCGFSGYREFVFTYQKDHQHLLKHFDHIQRSLTKKVLIDYDQILTATNNLVNEEKLEEIATLIDSSKRVYFYGIGSSGLVAMEIKSRFMRLGVVCDAITDKNNLIWTTTILDSSCLVIGLSLSGQTEEVMEHLDLAAQKGAATALLTTKTFSTTQTHKIIPVASVRNLNYGNRISPQIPLLIMLDIIYAYFQAIDREKKETIFKQTII